MKSNHTFTIILLVAGGLAGAYITKRFFTPRHPSSSVKLEEILSIKELHLVRHRYNDLFFIHRRNDSTKAVRVIVEVPVTITAYLNLKDIQLVKEHDSVKQVILPHARIDPPVYEINNMRVHKTRAFQLHAGADLYPEVARYLQATINNRMEAIRMAAIRNDIMVQAEVEGSEYIRSLLNAIGRSDILISFNNERQDQGELNNYMEKVNNYKLTVIRAGN